MGHKGNRGPGKRPRVGDKSPEQRSHWKGDSHPSLPPRGTQRPEPGASWAQGPVELQPRPTTAHLPDVEGLHRRAAAGHSDGEKLHGQVRVWRELVLL